MAFPRGIINFLVHVQCVLACFSPGCATCSCSCRVLLTLHTEGGCS